MRIPVVILALAAFAATSASAQAPADEPVATANATSSAPTTQQKIDRYLATSPAEVDRDELSGPPDDDRRVHGVIELSVGTGGYRSGHIALEAPIGEQGTLALSYGKTKSDEGCVYGPDVYDRAPMTFEAWPDGRAGSMVDCGAAVGIGGGMRTPSISDRARGALGNCSQR